MPRQPAFSPAELAAIERVTGQFSLRDVCLFRLMLASGLRIAEALKVRISDVMLPTGVIRSDLICTRANLKGGRGAKRKAVKSRVIPLADSVKPAIQELVVSLVGFAPNEESLAQPLFQGRGRRPLSRRQATYRLRDMLLRAGLTDRSGYGWHSARRTFAAAIYDLTGHDVNLTRQIMGHAHLASTIVYLPENDEAARAAILALGRRVAAENNLKSATAAPHFAEIRQALV